MEPFNYHEIRAFLLLNRLKLEGRRRTVALLADKKSPQQILEQLRSEKQLDALMTSGADSALEPDEEIDLCTKKNIQFLTLADIDYPALLKEIPDPPLLLYQKGEILKSDQNAIAVVGTRHPSFYGCTQAKRFAHELSLKGLTIISGLARGIDQIAHETALQVSYGRTVAVMGCGLDVIYPRENKGLFERIAERGAVLSEYSLGTPPLPENFPRRNRILSGLAYGVFVVEAHARSGSLITAHQALEQGREVFALPGPVDQLTSHGTHQLLKEGACLVENPGDILEVLASRLKRENPLSHENPKPSSLIDRAKDLISFLTFSEKEDTAEIARRAGEKQTLEPVTNRLDQTKQPKDFALIGTPFMGEADTVIEALQGEGALTQEEILNITGLEPSKMPGLLLKLELAQKIRRAPDGKYHLRSTDKDQRPTN